MIISVLVVLAVLVIACWIVSIAPLPKPPFPEAKARAFGYVIVGLVAIYYLLKIAGIA